MRVTISRPRLAWALWLGCTLLMLGCARPSQEPAAVKAPEPPPRDLLAEMAVLASGPDGIEVQPLPDPELEDLLAAAEQIHNPYFFLQTPGNIVTIVQLPKTGQRYP